MLTLVQGVEVSVLFVVVELISQIHSLTLSCDKDENVNRESFGRSILCHSRYTPYLIIFFVVLSHGHSIL